MKKKTDISNQVEVEFIPTEEHIGKKKKLDINMITNHLFIRI